MGGARGRGRRGESPLQSFKMSLAPLCEETVHTCTGNGSFTTGYPKDFLYRIKKITKDFLDISFFPSLHFDFSGYFFSEFLNACVCHKIRCNKNQILI